MAWFSRQLKELQKSIHSSRSPSLRTQSPVLSTQPSQSEKSNMVADIFSTGYASRARRLVDLASTLRGIGPESLSIPQIVVIGGQSSGKSSLVEGVTGIRVPRDSGTCTRCPMECHMKRESGPWSCQVSLRFRYDALGNEIETPTSVPFGPILTNPTGVEPILRRAQAAILNPNEDPQKFLSISEKQLQDYKTDKAFNNGTLKFSKNAVCIEIRDPDAVNLSFVDLPGLIANEEQSCISLVENMVRSHIEQPCIILVTIPMSDDMENQRAMRIAKEVDPKGVRTIGVLTKPDTLTTGSTSAFQKWKTIMAGENPSHALRLGYYCVKLPDDQQRAADMMSPPSRATRQSREMLFFNTTDPWNATPNKSKFGLSNLLEELSKNLMRMLDEALPGLRSRTQSQLDECRSDLYSLPTAFTGDATTEVLHRINSFCSELREIVNGFSHDKSFIRANRKTYRQFKRRIRLTTPQFTITADGGGRNESDDASETGTVVANFSDEEQKVGNSGTVPRDLDYVEEVINKSISWELPHNIPFDAKRRLICEYTDLWDKPAFDCYEEVARRLEDLLERLIEKHFSRFKALCAHAGKLITDHLDLQREKASTAVRTALSLEKNPVFTQNLEYLEHLRNVWLQKYRSSYSNPRRSTVDNDDGRSAASTTAYDNSWGHHTPTASPVERVINVLGGVGRATSPFDIAKVALKELGVEQMLQGHGDSDDLIDEYGEEIIVMADVRAYFEVAYKRIIDYIPMTVEHALNQGFADSIEIALVQKLDVCAPNASIRLKDYVAEDPSVIESREKLRNRASMLEKVHAELRSFG